MLKPRLITFYLPQYHPIKENNEWWGEGFTDWRNVVKGKPRFNGHYQPQIPSDLGFYDLRLEEARVAQAEMAKQHGIDGFCYYHYWFNGRMLLEKPFNEVLNSGKPDFPFCLCWANENWTRRWDGLENEILMEQNYEKYDPVEHIIWLSRAFKDNRYIKVNGKPLFLIYNLSGVPDIADKIRIWKKTAVEHGLKGIYICSVKSVHNSLSDEEAIKLGFDALVEFIPSNDIHNYKKTENLPKYYLYGAINRAIRLLKLEKLFGQLPRTMVLDYKKIARSRIENIFHHKIFPCVIPSWDNSARKKNSTVIQNNSVEDYGQWLDSAIKKVESYPDDEKIVFINAWNEWAEGCHLEPDMKFGKAFLEATLKEKNKYN